MDIFSSPQNSFESSSKNKPKTKIKSDMITL